MAILSRRIASAEDPIYKNGVILTSKRKTKDSEQPEVKTDTEHIKQQEERTKEEK